MKLLFNSFALDGELLVLALLFLLCFIGAWIGVDGAKEWAGLVLGGLLGIIRVKQKGNTP